MENTDPLEPVFSAEFPAHIVVTGKRPEGKGQKAPVLKPPVTLEGLTREKALKFAQVANATVRDADGKVLAKPKIKLTDLRTDGSGNAKEITDLKAQVAKLTEAIEGKANKPGPKAKKG